jgi:tRNA A-37 threonylcarbamoyl transferase component Bud32
MGRVWEARDELLGRDVAIKEIAPDGLSAAELGDLRERAIREARAIAQVNHPNVVRIFDVVTENDAPWIVMELVRSRSLLDVVNNEGPMQPERVARIGFEVLGALQAAHKAGILHRDVKPANVLIADDGRVVLTDFGLATLAGDSTMTRTGVVLGSPSYLAPERALDEPARPGSDLWSLGATLFAAVEGRPPYVKSSPMATLAALMVDPPPVPQRAGVLRPALEALLKKDPSERAYAEEASRLLSSAAKGVMPAPMEAKPTSEAKPATGVTPAAAEKRAAAPEISEKAGTPQAVMGEPKPLTVPDATTLASGTPRSGRAHRRWWTIGAAAAVILIAVGVAVARPLFGNTSPSGDIAAAAENPGAAPSAVWSDPVPANVPSNAGVVPRPSVSAGASAPAAPPGAPTTVPGQPIPATPGVPPPAGGGAVIVTTVPTTKAPAPPPPAVGRQISSFATETCLDARDPSGYIKLWQCQGVDSQKFSFPGDGTMRVLRKCVQIVGVSNGAGLQVTSCNPGASNQHFNLNKAYDLVAVQPDRCVDVQDSNGGNNVRAQIWDCAGAGNQKWHY